MCHFSASMGAFQQNRKAAASGNTHALSAVSKCRHLPLDVSEGGSAVGPPGWRADRPLAEHGPVAIWRAKRRWKSAERSTNRRGEARLRCAPGPGAFAPFFLPSASFVIEPGAFDERP